MESASKLANRQAEGEGTGGYPDAAKVGYESWPLRPVRGRESESQAERGGVSCVVSTCGCILKLAAGGKERESEGGGEGRFGNLAGTAGFW